MERIAVRPLVASDQDWADALLTSAFGGRNQARLDEVIDPLDLPGLVAELGGERAGIATLLEREDDIEIVAIAASVLRRGVGTALVDAAAVRARGRRLWLVTTNDNLDALRFYQRRGFRLTTLRPGAVDRARRDLKPGIDLVGGYGIPIRDELVLDFDRAS